MGFDIQYLLWLQELRNATGGMFDEFFNALSKFAVDILPFLPLVVFWGVDKKWGYRFLASYGLGEIIIGLIKLTVCAGAALGFAWKEWFDQATIVAAQGDHWGNFISKMILALFAVCVWPLMIRKRELREPVNRIPAEKGAKG